MFQAMYILAPNSAVASVSYALPSPKSLVMGAGAAKPASLSGVTLATKSKAADKSTAAEKVMCSYCGKMFGKQGIRNHTAKCAQQHSVKGCGQQMLQGTGLAVKPKTIGLS